MDRNAEQDDYGADQRVARLGGEREDQQHGGGSDEERRYDGVSPDAVGAAGRLGWGLAVAEDEDRCGNCGVEEPFGEDGQREKSLEGVDQKQQRGRDGGLQDQGSRGRLEAGMYVSQAAEEEAVAC